MSSPSQQQHKRVAEPQDGEQGKRLRALATPNGEIQIKQERHSEYWQGGEGADQGAEGEGALLPVQTMEEPQINVRFAVSHLHCHQCLVPLKPHTFQCEAGHVVCHSCRGNHAQSCAGAGTFVHNTALDGIVRDAKVSCENEAYGCRTEVVYHEASDHHRSCRFAPCRCPVPGCGHYTSPARLVEHFSSDHAWRVTEVDYARPFPCKLAVVDPEDKQVLVGKADGSVFLISLCALGSGTAVSLVCVRASAAAPQYTYNVWAEVPGNALMLTSNVGSTDLAGGIPATDQVVYLALSRLLYGESGEPPALTVRINKVGASGTRSRSPAAATPPATRSRSPAAATPPATRSSSPAAATPPSSVPRRMLQ